MAVVLRLAHLVPLATALLPTASIGCCYRSLVVPVVVVCQRVMPPGLVASDRRSEPLGGGV